MKKISTAFIFCFLFGECFSQAGEWVWIKGSNLGGQPGNYGVRGVSSPTNNPPGLYEPCEWTDLNGNFWLFGGQNFANESFADLWKYDRLTNEWTWVKGPGIPNPIPVFGIKGIPSPLNNPPLTSYGVASFIDLQGNLWLFEGGSNNLWKYDISTNEWTWMNGPGPISQPGVYGIQGIPDIANYPGPRTESVSCWTDNAGDLWLFGGADAIHFTGAEPLNDLWRYHIASNEWTWMKGDSTIFGIGNYGTKGIEDAANNPRARWAYSHWKDTTGNLWFFGGGVMLDTMLYYFNDLWRFNPAANNWTWMSGSNVPNTAGIFGTKCNADFLNVPDSRFENRAVISDPKGDFGFLAELLLQRVLLVH